MGGLFGIVSKSDCVDRLFYGTDYHCHLGTRRGGMAVSDGKSIDRTIHDITAAQFRSKFAADIARLKGTCGIGAISDFEDQPLIIGSHLGIFAIATVGVVRNAEELTARLFRSGSAHFSEMSGSCINPTEIVASLVSSEESFEAGIQAAQQAVEGSCSFLILTMNGIYAARDRYGRTPLIVAKGPDGYSVTMETCALPNIGHDRVRDLGPGEVALISTEGIEQRVRPGNAMQICAFLWVYYGYPASTYEGVNVESFRYTDGAGLAAVDGVAADGVAGIPDSGSSYAIGYAQQARLPFIRPFVKYTPTWSRSFMPQNQAERDLVARMKLIPVKELTEGKRLLFCDDSIVRGTQLRDTFGRLIAYGAREIHLRIACPLLLHGCRFLNFSRSRSDLDLAARKAVQALEGRADHVPDEYHDPRSPRYAAMVGYIAKSLDLTSLTYQTLEGMVQAIGLPKEDLCTYCWTGACANLTEGGSPI
jgi:amidophosphoribosyltransferase